MTETCPAYTLSESGTNQATTQETGNSLTADYSRSLTGSDTYTLTESGTNAYGSYSETVTGSDAYTQTETGNTLNQTFSRSTSGTGTYTRQESGPGGSQGPWSDSLSYTVQETGDWRAGSLSQSETGCDRYGLLEQFDNVSNTASGAAPGHLNFSPFGLPFSDDPPAGDEQKSESLAWTALSKQYVASLQRREELRLLIRGQQETIARLRKWDANGPDYTTRMKIVNEAYAKVEEYTAEEGKLGAHETRLHELLANLSTETVQALKRSGDKWVREWAAWELIERESRDAKAGREAAEAREAWWQANGAAVRREMQEEREAEGHRDSTGNWVDDFINVFLVDVPRGFGKAAVRTVKQPLTLITDPVDFITHPKASIDALADRLIDNPGEVLGEGAFYYLLGKVASKGWSKLRRAVAEEPGVVAPKGGSCFVAGTEVVLAEVEGELVQTADAGTGAPGGWEVWPVLAGLAVYVVGGVGWYCAQRRKRVEEEMIADQVFSGKDRTEDDTKGTPGGRPLPKGPLLLSARTANSAGDLVARDQVFQEVSQGKAAAPCLDADRQTVSTPVLEMQQGQSGSRRTWAIAEEKGQPRSRGAGKRSRWWGRCWLLGSLLLGSLLLYQGEFAPRSATSTKPEPTAKSGASYLTRKIEELRVGDRVLADNPTDEQDLTLGAEVDPATWRKVQLRARKRDGSSAEVVLLRPTSWLEERGAQAGGTLEIAILECGIRGDAEVIAIAPCPPIQPGAGRVVTGTFKHSSAKVIELYVEGHSEPIGTTGNHLFWSEDRASFIRADELRPGERLRALEGRSRVVRVVSSQVLVPVYNLEVQIDHTFHVTLAGLLVHNAIPDPGKTIAGIVGDGVTVERIAIPERGGIPLTGEGAFKDAKGITYFVVDRNSGRILKVGSTGSPNSAGQAGRLSEYQQWARAEVQAWGDQGWTLRELDLYYVRSEGDAGRTTAGTLEARYRAELEAKSERLTWDYKTQLTSKGPKPKEFGGKTTDAPSLRDLDPFCP